MSDIPSKGAAPRPTDYQYDPEGLTGAAATLGRLTVILPPHKVRHSELSPAYHDALGGELRLLRAQLYSTGLFETIVNVDLR